METRGTKRGSEDRVFPLAWYPLAWSTEVTTRPLKRKIIGRDVVLFRDSSGKIQCVDAYCTHRGADLSLGTCQGDHLQCPYHGWQFAGDGSCIAIPSQPERPIPAFAHTVGFPVQERAHMIWVYPATHGEGTPPALRLFPELDDPKFVLTPFGTTWKAHLTRVVESVLDVAHLAFVHKKTIGRTLRPEIPRVDFEAEGNRITIRNGGGVLEYEFPQQWLLKPREQGRSGFLQFVAFTPIDQEETALFGLAGRTFARKVPGMNRLFSYFSNKVLREDQAIVESQHPRPIPEALQMEAHVGADAPQVQFRKRWYAFLTNEEPRREC